MGHIDRPAPQEYAAFYGTYVGLVSGGDICVVLSEQFDTTRQLLRRVAPELEGHRYESGKWSVRDVVGHLIDTERLFVYRAMSFARGDRGPLPGMEQDHWVSEGGADSTPLSELVKEFSAVRASTLGFFSRLVPEHSMRTGIASGVEFTVRSLAFIIAGHEIHHRTVLEERYGLPGL